MNDAGVAEPAAGLPYERVLRKGFRWLVFPKPLEREFYAECFKTRKRQLLFSAVPSILAFVVAGMFDKDLMPDTTWVVDRVHLYITLLLSLGTIPILLTRRPWMLDALYAAGASIGSVVSIWGISQSQSLTAASHSAVVALFVLSVAILARLRFWFSAAVGVTTIVAFIFCMGGHAEDAQIIIRDDLEILISATLFALLANYMLETRERRAYLLRKLDSSQRTALELTQRRLHGLAMLDPLTGLHNRRQFDSDLSAVWTTAIQFQDPISLLLIDIDFFKRYNDGYGHPAGDACLRRISSILQQVAAHTGGSAARFGGEEFAILLPGFDLADALKVAEELCQAVQKSGIKHAYSPISEGLTISVGVGSAIARCPLDHCEVPQRGRCDAVERLIATADEGLYRAKTLGRNQVMPGQCHAQGATAETSAAQDSVPRSTKAASANLGDGDTKRRMFSRHLEVETWTPHHDDRGMDAERHSELGRTLQLRRRRAELRAEAKAVESISLLDLPAESDSDANTATIAAPRVLADAKSKSRSTAGDAQRSTAINEEALLESMRANAWRLAFPQRIENEFQRARADERLKLLIRGWLSGAALFAFFTMHDIHLFTDIVTMGTFWLSAIVVGLLVQAAAFRLVPMKGTTRDLISGVGSALAGIGLIIVLSESKTTLAYSHMAVLMLVVLQPGVALRLPFRNVFVVVAATILSFLGFYTAHNLRQWLIEVDVSFMVGVTAVFTVLASYQLERAERIDYLLGRVELRRRSALLEATERLRKLSSIDSLTGVANRRQFETLLQVAWWESREAGYAMSLLIVDVDFFKLYNDGYGHPAGDQCLKEVARVLEMMARDHGGAAARLGGEEFAVLMPRTEAGAALALGERICVAIRERGLVHRFSTVASHVTVSIGVSTLFPQRSVDPQQLLSLADEALYRAKAAGRNQVAFADTALDLDVGVGLLG